MISSSVSNVFPPLKDETAYSHLERIAQANAFSSARAMVKALSVKPEIKIESPEVRTGLYDIPSLLGISAAEACRWHTKTSLSLYLRLFIPPGKYARYVNASFRRLPEESSFRNNAPLKHFKRLRLCPECIAGEKQRMGFYYIHRSHQLPEVKVCHKHGCSLLDAGRKRPDMVNVPICDRIEVEECDMETELIYAKATHSLMKTSSDINADDVKAFLRDHIDKRSRLRVKVVNKSYALDLKETVMAMTEIAGGHDLTALVQTIERDARDRRRETTFDGIELITETRRALPVAARCSTCGEIFITDMSVLEQGWRCPKCDEGRSDTQIMADLVKTLGKGEYELKSEIVDFKKMTLYHKACREEITIKCGDFLGCGRRCKCEMKVSEEEMRKRVESKSSLLLMRYEGVAKELLLKARPCGHEFTATYHNIEKNGFKCIVCASQAEKAKRRFEQFIENLDDGYEIIGWNKDALHVRMRHSVCGKVHTFNRKTFLQRGVRCPCLTEEYRGELKEFLQYIRETIGEGVPFKSSDEILLRFGSYSAIHHKLSRLYKAGRIQKLSKGIYVLPKEGEKHKRK